MLDTGSTVTLLRDDIADKLGLKGRAKPLQLQGLHPIMEKKESRIVNLKVTPVDSNDFYDLSDVRTVSHLPLPFQSVRSKLVRKWPHLRGLNLHIYEGGQPTILIGQDHGDLNIAREVRKGPPNAPIAALTRLGWVLTGRVPNASQNYAFFTSHEDEVEDLHKLVKDYFSLDSFGVRLQDIKPRSREDHRAQEIMDATARRIDVHWETGLLWRYDNVKFPESRTRALQRLQAQERKMDRNPHFAEALTAKMKDYLEKAYIRKLNPEEIVETDKSYYLPYFGVINPNKPGKFRLVYDAASKSHGTSLNDMLLSGPDKLVPLPTVLMKLRQRPIAVTADIKEMFHQVRIRTDDLPAQKFLYRGMDRNRDPDVYQIVVMIFGATCSPSSAQEVKNRNALEFQEAYPEAAEAIISKHYVDDYLDCFNTVEEAKKIFNEVILVHSRGGFCICNWVTNRTAVLEDVGSSLIAKDQTTLNLAKESDTEAEVERVLGLHWKPSTDWFTFAVKFHKVRPDVSSGKVIPTKREALSLVMSVFHPLGFLAHFTIKGKIALQQAWKSGIGWDDQLPSHSHKKWNAWMRELKKIPSFEVPRCYTPSFTSADEVQLHVFVDASEVAFSSVGYFRILKGGILKTAFVMAKTRVAPLKHHSIPRLELLAAVMGSRMSKKILESHDRKIDRCHFWSDSKTVICWIRSESRRFQQFVANRVSEIQELTNVQDWHWISTEENVADEATRDTESTNWEQESRWCNGPEFLGQSEEQWPHEKQIPVPTEDLELKKSSFFVIDEVRLYDKYSIYSKLIRVTAWILRAIQRFRRKSRGQGELIPQEISNAEKYSWKEVQMEMYSKELNLLRAGEPLPKKSPLFKILPTFDCDGILRLEGRIQRAKFVPDDVRNPVILPNRHKVTRLLIMHYHIMNEHQGQEHVVNELRRKYFIPSIRHAVRGSWFECQRCRIRAAKPRIPRMGQLPEGRLEMGKRPFTSTGMDYFGPLGVTVGRRHEKRYGCLFTCFTTRAVHLELTTDLSTDGCLMSIRRFAAVRGDPRRIYSDNGTNFVGANNELREALKTMDPEGMKRALTMRGIQWVFNPPSAPHMGGSWERIFKAVKIAMKSSLKERYPNEETLRTIFAETARLVNGHPLTYVPTGADDDIVLTPNHFLFGTSDGSQPNGTFDDADISFRRQWRIAMRLSEHYWRRWVKDYLPTLVRREKWNQPNPSLKVGDLGILISELKPREEWPLGKVVTVYAGEDGIIRSLDFQVGNSVYRRPAHKICVFVDAGPGSEDVTSKPGGSVAETPS